MHYWCHQIKKYLKKLSVFISSTYGVMKTLNFEGNVSLQLHLWVLFLQLISFTVFSMGLLKFSESVSLFICSSISKLTCWSTSVSSPPKFDFWDQIWLQDKLYGFFTGTSYLVFFMLISIYLLDLLAKTEQNQSYQKNR